MTTEKSKKKHSPFVVSKRVPTQFSTRVSPQICDSLQLAFSACGNSIKAYNLKTGIQVGSMRSAKILAGDKPGFQDVHKAYIVGMGLLTKDSDGEDIAPRLVSVCKRGVFAEWDPSSNELLAVTDLDIGENKIKLCSIQSSHIVTQSAEAHEFRVFDMGSKKMIRQFP